MSATIKDVAERAKVSKALVSRYLNGKPGVSQESRAKIAKAIGELHFTPNALARSLVTQKTHTIGVMMEVLDSDPALSVLRGLENGMQEHDAGDQYTLIYTCSFGDVERKKRQLQYLTQGRADGVIMFGSQTSNDELISRLAETEFPIVLIENDLSSARVDRVLVDNVGGAFEATEALLRTGHKKIAHIAGNMNLKITMDRMQGYVQALQYYSVPVERELISFPDFSAQLGRQRQPMGWETIFVEQGYMEMKRMLSKGILPDALFVPTDFLAFGAMRALKEASLRVPEDVSIIGFDNEINVGARLGYPPITSVMQPLREAGSKAVGLCLDRILDPGRAMERIMLKTSLADHGTVLKRG